MPLSSSQSRLTSAFFAVIVATSLVGCSAIATVKPSDSSASSSAPDCPGADVPLSEVTAAGPPTSLIGESTACLPTRAVEPIAKHPAPALPVTVTDNDGNSVTVTDVDRIIAIDRSGTLAATVFALGLGDRVVARDNSTEFPGTADLPLVTQNGHELAAEAVLSLTPTLILTDRTVGSRDVLTQLREAGIPIVVITAQRSIGDNEILIDQVATALGVPEVGQKLNARLAADTATTIADIAALAPTAVADRPRILFLYMRGAASIYYIFGAESGADSLIDSLGGIDVASEIGWQGMKPLTAEALVATAPDLLLVMTTGLESVGGVDGLLESIPAIAATPAGQNRRIVNMADDQVLAFGPRTPEVLDALARAIYAPGADGASHD
ncbi:hemin ABC transporter substrate-binding protein [Leifsonia sp. YAF41]|uniref:heme/hemin ABC transporter substrate-binding protein n=1 Tax=Leifsonia sp. YAF41 TaxID=3233086 RepID=UPI003F9B6689